MRVGAQPFAERLQHGNAARHRRLERERGTMVVSQLEKLVAARGNDRFVRGHHVLTRPPGRRG